MFLFEQGWSLFGGTAVFYLGIYGYGTQITDNSDRASTLARIDGFEMIGKILGTLLSPIILNQFSAKINYFCKMICTTLAIIYALLYVKTSQRKSFRIKANRENH